MCNRVFLVLAESKVHFIQGSASEMSLALAIIYTVLF